MKKFRFTVMSLVIVLSVFSLAGCSKYDEEAQNEAIKEAVDEALKEKEEKKAKKDSASESADQKEQVEAEEDNEEFSFADLANLEFWYSSGAGGWGTCVYVAEDGSFYGMYQDSDMGDYTDEYPEGTVYFCDFSGQFSQPVELNDYTYSVEIEAMNFTFPVGTDEISDNRHYIYTEAYGLEDTDYFHFYLPGAPLDELPQEYREWVGYFDLSQTEDTTLPYYGLYNVNMRSGFSSYDTSEVVSGEIYAADTPSIDERLASVTFTEEQEKVILDKDDVTQGEMNAVAAAIYQMWDDELNWIWAELETRLDADTMEQLRAEQREWIKKKEAAMKKAGLDAEGGTMQPLLEDTEGASMTKDRCYELANWLR